MKPAAIRQRRFRERLRARLIKKLGGKCVGCGGFLDLQFDHKKTRTWKHTEKWSNKRLRLYEQEINAGLIELRCGDCNRRKGKPAAENEQSEMDELNDFLNS